VKFLQTAGFPHAERRALCGNLDRGDITGTPGLVWECKAGAAATSASDNQVIAWLKETEVERVNAKADLGTLVVQRARKHPRDWWAVTTDRHGNPVWTRLASRIIALRAMGYGNPIGEDGP